MPHRQSEITPNEGTISAFLKLRRGHVGVVKHGCERHGRGGHKDKCKDKDTDKDKYKVFQIPKSCYIFEEQGVLGEDVRTVDMVDMNMADIDTVDTDIDMVYKYMNMVDMNMPDMDIVDMDMMVPHWICDTCII